MKNGLRKELQRSLDQEQFDVTTEGLYFPRQGVLAKGKYYDRINDANGNAHKTLWLLRG